MGIIGVSHDKQGWGELKKIIGIIQFLNLSGKKCFVGLCWGSHYDIELSKMSFLHNIIMLIRQAIMALRK